MKARKSRKTGRTNLSKRRAPKSRRRGLGGSLLAAIFMLVALFTAAWLAYPHFWDYLSRQEAFRIEKISFENADHIRLSELNSLLPPLEGVNLFAIDPPMICSAIRQHPWVDDVTLYRRLPDRLIISVTERRPAALISGERIWALDASGVLLPTDSWSGTLDVPLINYSGEGDLKAGCVLVHRPVLDILIGLEALRRRLPELWRMVSEVSWDEKGQLLLYSSASHTRILLGSKPNWQQMVDFYSFLIFQGGGSGIEDIDFVDLRFRGQVIVRKGV